VTFLGDAGVVASCMLNSQTAERRPSWRGPLRAAALATALFLIASAGTIALLWRASDIWAATHGHGTRGTWTATRQDTGSKMIRWYGDFHPADGGPVRHNVPMEGHVDPDHGKGTVRSAYRSGTAYALPGSAQWLALALVAMMPLAIAAFMAWLVIEQWQHRPRRGRTAPSR
jgi:hypothetical protein